MSEAKPFSISKWEVWEAYRRVKANQGAAGVDEQTIADFDRNLKGNLYKIWNRMSSGRVAESPCRDAGRHPVEPRIRGTPQGGVMSPLLANLFMHYAFDVWMVREFPCIPFERYADDGLVHCASEAQAQEVRGVHSGTARRMCHSELHPAKTQHRVPQGRRSPEARVRQVRLSRVHLPASTSQESMGQVLLVSFLPAMSTKAAKAVRKTIREWRMASTRATRAWKTSRVLSTRLYEAG